MTAERDTAVAIPGGNECDLCSLGLVQELWDT